MKGRKTITNRDARIKPVTELGYLSALFGFLVLMIFIAEFLASDESEYAAVQSKAVYAFFILLVTRLFTFKSWGEHYREVFNLMFAHANFDQYTGVSLFSVMLDIFVLSCLFFWIQLERLYFVRIPVAGLVYLLLIGFSSLWRKRIILRGSVKRRR